MANVPAWEDIKEDLGKCTPLAICQALQSRYLDRYKQREGSTFCNVFFTDVVQQMRLDAPYHWMTRKGGPLRWLPGVQLKGREYTANDLVEWFRMYGQAYGWIQLGKEDAEKLAEHNRLVAVTWHSGSHMRSGHIAVLLGKDRIAQAGKGVPFIGMPIETGFGELPVEFWGHVEANDREE